MDFLPFGSPAPDWLLWPTVFWYYPLQGYSIFSVQYFFFHFNNSSFGSIFVFSFLSAVPMIFSYQSKWWVKRCSRRRFMIFWSQGRELARYAGNGPDGFVLDWLIRFPRRAKMDFVKRVEMDLVETHLEQLCMGLFCAGWNRLGNTLCLQTSPLFM